MVSEDERYSQMVRMRESGKLLREIGEEFGICRERVRQIIGNTGFKAAQIRRKKILKLENTPASEIATTFDLSRSYVMAVFSRNKMRATIDLTKDTSVSIGEKWEHWIVDRLNELGIDSKLSPTRGMYYDIEANGYKIDVKACESGHIPQSQVSLRNPRWRFNISKRKGKKPVDFYIFIIVKPIGQDVFIVPYNAVPVGMTDVTFCWPTNRPEIGKYQQYHNRYDLLLRI